MFSPLTMLLLIKFFLRNLFYCLVHDLVIGCCWIVIQSFTVFCVVELSFGFFYVVFYIKYQNRTSFISVCNCNIVLDCSYCNTFSSFSDKFKQLVFSSFNFIVDFIACCFYECLCTVVIVIWNPDFVCWFSEYFFPSKASLVSGILKKGLDFYMSVKVFQFFFKGSFIKICLSWYKA